MARTDRHLRRIILIVGVALTVTILSLYSLDYLEPVELGLNDLRARQCQVFTPRPSDQIVHVDLDDATLEEVGAWPWPRTAMAELIDEMSTAGAKSIALDVLYSQPQKPEWVPEPHLDGSQRTYRLIDHDANLAAAFKRAKNVLVPVSLRFVYTHRQTPAVNRAIKLLTETPDLSPMEFGAALKRLGIEGSEATDVEGIFFELRREAVSTRIEQWLEKRQSKFTSQATTLPADPSTPGDESVLLELRQAIFPRLDPRETGPESRLVDELYEQAMSAHAIDRLGRASEPHAAAFGSKAETLPARRLIEAAGATGFVDYPNIADGTIRSVPLFIEFHGKWIPQFGLRVACQVLEVDPSDLKITPTQITIPAGKLSDGSARPERAIPVRTMRRNGAGGRVSEYPLVMDIPWFGGQQWWTMYDTSRPSAKAQHLSMSRVANVITQRRSLEYNSQKIDEAISFILDAGVRPGGYATLGLAKEEAAAYFKNRPALSDWPRREAAARRALEVLKQVGLEEQFAWIKPEAMTAQERGQSTELKIQAAQLKAGLLQTPLILKLINELRAELKSKLGGKGVFVGWTSVWTAADRKATPLHSDAPGVIGHAVVANAVLTGDFWQTLPGWMTGTIVVVFGLLVTVSVARFTPARSVLAAMALFTGYTLVNAYLVFDYGNYILDLAAPLLVIITTWAGGTAARLIIEAREKARITKRFATYVDPDLVNYVLDSRDTTVFTGQRRQTAVVFTDLEGFTKLSEKLKEDVVPLLNDFMGRATRVIKKHNGFVNKFLGDGILFFFNAPRPNARFVPDAIDAILDLQRMMGVYNDDLAAKGLGPVRLRAGMTAGEVTAGDAGSEERADYTVLGDLVNLASRLESANKFFGTSSLITEAAKKEAGDRFLFRPVGVIQVVGRQADERVFEVMALKADATAEQLQIADATTKLCEAVARGDATECLKAIQELEAITQPTKLTQMYRSHCEPYLNGSKSGPMLTAIVLGEK